MKNEYIIEKVNLNYLHDALDLVWKTFLEFEAPEFSEEGINEFKNFISDTNFIKEKILNSEFLMWTCTHENEVVGVITTRPPCHIVLLFVNSKYHNQGIGRSLFNTALNYYRENGEFSKMTVKSSPYAVNIYEKFGFTKTDNEQTINGIRFTPMEFTF